MPYEQQSWTDGETLISAERMNHIEAGIAAVGSKVIPSPLVPAESGNQYRIIAGAIRKTGGVWGLIHDEGHTPQGIESVTDRGNDLRIHYGFTAKRVGSLVVTADESYNVLGYSFGASVGLDGSTIKIHNSTSAPVGGYVSYGADGWAVATGNLTSVAERNANTIRITHPPVEPATDIYLSVTGRGSGKYTYRAGSSGVDRTDVEIYDMSGNPVTAWKKDMAAFVTRQAAPVAQVKPADMPEGNTNIWIYGVMEV